MNCHEFNQHLPALVYARLMDAAVRDTAQRHAEQCAACATRLRAERALGAALQTTARAETQHAPARLKTELLAAFAHQHAAVPVSAATVVDLAQVRQARLARRSWWAIAAALAVCALLGLALRRETAPASDTVAQNQAVQAVTPTATPVAVTPAWVTPNAVSAPAAREKRTVAAAPQKVAFTPPAQHKSPRSVKARAEKAAPAIARQPEIPAELVTDYIPLTYVAASTAMESGQVVRIAMPRASAVALGLPAHLEEREETIKADVVLGDDGLARQIRFVYQPDSSRKMNR